jgi:small subunit ribosomal protein S2
MGSNMAPYIYMERNGIHIINLYKTAAKIEEANEALKKSTQVKNTIRSYKKQAKTSLLKSKSCKHATLLKMAWWNANFRNYP